MHKICNRNTVKVSYSCMPNGGSVITSHSKKLTNAEKKQTKHCNCRKKQECPLEGKCRSEDIIYKCVVTAADHPWKVYLSTAEGNFKQRYYDHKMSYRSRKYANETSLSKYIWELKDKHHISPNLMCCIVKKTLIPKNQLNSRALETIRPPEPVTPNARLFESCNRKLNSQMFVTRMCWKPIYCNNKTNYNSSERYGLKTLKCPKQVKELVLFENYQIDMLKLSNPGNLKTSSLQYWKKTSKQLSNPKKY